MTAIAVPVNASAGRGISTEKPFSQEAGRQAPRPGT